ncbi:MAG: cytochrome C biogenesis protein [Hydrogenophilales bacterium 16-64-46]|nr:MAG: cytochrome C biogenesis protein [Hydrogenophilales bacterium 12-64-13]OYZ06581.1 MAG: cytochrome C biogenesis protein [Hydrogenophilales bacterium 16-64-46]OZA39289.1 MAG: cytochrome C biogenesis protein [Hydrogenophilales bacterium 17-64-34]HQS98845.1 cytochrome c biogenesis protein ResB [Thiobacillus sp.]
MNTATASFGKSLFELLSSMRFAISLLSILAIASIIGTVLKQAEPYNNYVIQLGPYWFQVFEKLGLYDVYHAAWFLVILTFLVASVSVCIWRNAPNFAREMKSFREQVSEQSLAAFKHKHEAVTAHSPESLAAQAEAYLTGQGYAVKRVARDDGLLLAAKAGKWNRLGYFLAHAAIVLICIGGLMDGNLVFKAQQLLGMKKIETRDIPQSEVPAISRLSPDNPSFRGSVQIPEGSSADVAFLNVADGYLVQDLPFTVALKQFRIEHYSTGQPKSFESDLEIFDRSGKKIREATIAVNHPLIHDGIAIYQASFADGGTKLSLRGWNLFASQAATFEVDGVVHQNTTLTSAAGDYTLEFTDFRPFNIENVGGEIDTGRDAMAVLGGSPVSDNKHLRNVGPSFQYKLRDARGQAREYSNYMLPMQLDDRWYMMSGVRETPNEAFRYLRMPLDASGSLDSFMRLRGALMNPDLRPEIAARFARQALPENAWNTEIEDKLKFSASQVLALFATGGFQALSGFIEARVPEAERDKAAETYLRILELSAFEALQIANRLDKQPPPAANDATGWLVRDTLNSLSDMFVYGAPIYLQLMQYDEVKASGLQLTRSPGKSVVYFGSLLLTLGVFFMFYVRERRVWIRIKPGHALLAMSAAKHTLDFDKEFAQHAQALDTLAK